MIGPVIITKISQKIFCVEDFSPFKDKVRIVNITFELPNEGLPIIIKLWQIVKYYYWQDKDRED